jgi:hypothetical protein
MSTHRSEAAPSNARPAAVVHVDLDGARHIYENNGWAYDLEGDPLFETGLTNLLDFFDRNGIRATLFTIAADLEDPRKLELLRDAVRRGHEIASHSMSHRRLAKLQSDEKKLEIAQSRIRLEAALGVEVSGFRAPSYDVDRECLDLLEEHGYTYDSSVFPTKDFANRLQIPDVSGYPHRPFFDSQLIELPLPSYRPGPFPFHPCYSLILGRRYFISRLRKFRKSGLPLVLLFHLTDVADPLPDEALPNWRARLMTLSHLNAKTKVDRCQAMLEDVKENYTITDTQTLLTNQKVLMQEVKSLTLAISTTHETGAAVFEGDTLKSAVSEERIDRVKFSTKYPPAGSIEAAIQTAGVDPKDIKDLIISGLPPSKLLPRMLRGQWMDFTEFHGFNDYFPHFNKVVYRIYYFYRAMRYRSIVKYFERTYGTKPKLHFVEHHLCHAAGAYRTAPFDDALIVTSDGVGDDLSLTVSEGHDGTITRLGEVRYPHSFGQFYTACTQILGFRGGRHEGKITGLSGYGTVVPELYDKVKSTIRQSGPDFKLDKRYYSEGLIRGFSLKKLRRGESLFDALQYRNYKAPLKKLVEGYKREDVAAVFQKLLEEEMVKVVKPYAE